MKNTAGRLDILALRVIERLVRRYENEHGAQGKLWEPAAPVIEDWTRRLFGPAPRKRRRTRRPC